MTVEVFKTDIQNPAEGMAMTIKILEHLSGYRITFDLEDCDKVMRIASKNGEIDVDAVLETGAAHAKKIELLREDVPIT